MERRTPGRDVMAYRIHDKIIIDGKLDEPAWTTASVLDGFHTIIDGESRPAASRTKVRVLRDDEYLYISAELEDKDIIAFHTEKNSRTWEDDVFEVFIKPLEDKHGYYEFHVTPRNTTLQLYIPERNFKKNFRDLIFEGEMKSAVDVRGRLNNRAVKDDGWTAEIAIPFSAFKDTAPPPGDGTEWTVAFCRYDYTHDPSGSGENSKELSSSAAFKALNFHRFEDYAKLIFLEK